MKPTIRFNIGLCFIVLLILQISEPVLATRYYSRAAGNWSIVSTWSNTAFNGAASASYPGQLSANDTAYVSGYTVTADVTPAYSFTLISFNHANTFSTADTRLLISTAGITLTCATFTMYDNNVNSHMDLQVSSSAIFQVNGNATITRGTTNTRSKRMQMLILNTARMNVTGNLTYTFNRATNGIGEGNEIQLDNSGRLDVTGSLIMTIGNNSGSSNQLNLVMNSASILNAGSVTQTVSSTNDGDDIIMNLNGGTMTVTGAWSSTIATTATTSSSTTLYMDGGTLTTGNFTFDQSGGTSGDMSILMNQVSTANASLLTINGNLVFIHNDGDDMEIETNANSTINVTGKFNTDVNVPSNGDIVSFDINGGVINITDSLVAIMNSNTNYFEVYIDGGTLTAKGIRFNQYGTGVGDMYIYLNNSSTASAATLTVGTYGMQFEDNGGDNLDLEINANSTLTINGDFTYNNNAANGNDRLLVKINTGSPAPSMTINGNFTGNLNTGTGSNDQIYFDINNGAFNCTGDMTFTTGAACTAGTHSNIEIDGASTSFTVGGIITLNHLGGDNNSNDFIHVGTNSGSPTFTAGALVLNGQGGNATRFRTSNAVITTINGDVTLSASAAGKTVVDLNGTSIFQLKGSFLRSPTPNRFGSLTTATNAVVKYIGTAGAQAIAGDAGSGGDAFSYHNIEINNTYATIPQLTMTAEEGDATIPNGSTLTFTDGVIASLPNAMFVINDGATCTEGNAGSYVDGPIKKVGNTPTTFVFPVGDDAVWARLAISQFTNFAGNTEFTCQYYFDPAPNNSPGYMGNTVGLAMDHVSHTEYWDLQRVFDTGNNADCSVKLYYEDSTRSGISDMTDLRVAHFETTGTSKWENQGQISNTQSGMGGTITSSVDLVNFSPITFGSWSGINPLPVELLSFHAITESDKTVLLKWEVLSQTNNDYFTVEKSKDGIVFEELTKVVGAGNLLQPVSYQARDMHPFTGTTFYRLKQTDFNGEFSYSKIEQVYFTKELFNINVYPNPSEGIFNVVSNNDISEIQLRITDIKGNIVLEKKSSERSFILDMNNFQYGIYFLQAVAERTIRNVKLVVQ